MYESPINRMVSDITSEIITNEEDELIAQIKKDVLYSIDKNELIKALQYDRQQYEKGYQDGINTLSEDGVIDWMVRYIGLFGIKSLMELVMKAIDKEQEEK